MTGKPDTIIIKRYASRRLYNSETSDYVTLDEVAGLIREGRDVQIVDRKTGEDLTRQYLLQIITEQEARGENILPVNVLMDIVRSYGEAAESIIPDFLSGSFEALKQQQAAMMQQFQNSVPPVFDPSAVFGDPARWQQEQADMLGRMMAPFMPGAGAQTGAPTEASKGQGGDETAQKAGEKTSSSEVDDIKQQLAELQDKLSKL